MMFIRPTIIRSPEVAKTLSESKFDHLITRDFDANEDDSIVTQQLKEFLQKKRDQETTE
jgi:type II secretory pathway component GspD/PulD (secretin)